jgi:hypothetical protein
VTLASLLPSLSLKHLDISFNGISAAGLRLIIQALSVYSNLSVLTLSGNQLNSEVSKDLSDFLSRDCCLKEFYADRMLPGDVGERLIASGIASNKSSSLVKFTGFMLGRALVSIGSPKFLMDYNNEQTLQYLSQSWNASIEKGTLDNYNTDFRYLPFVPSSHRVPSSGEQDGTSIEGTSVLQSDDDLLSFMALDDDCIASRNILLNHNNNNSNCESGSNIHSNQTDKNNQNSMTNVSLSRSDGKMSLIAFLSDKKDKDGSSTNSLTSLSADTSENCMSPSGVNLQEPVCQFGPNLPSATEIKRNSVSFTNVENGNHNGNFLNTMSISKPIWTGTPSYGSNSIFWSPNNDINDIIQNYSVPLSLLVRFMCVYFC